ncbi:sensor histidine kinase [Lacticaseibacillus kribbianus]|uniref:sensor histidine kinase n=1 Tax=Lacticaseibacillus kribbianus TaxID=2926292 RepID=UPI001CD64B09|nr:histidine kinase [Lacticaseibacillus kribbianus]
MRGKTSEGHSINRYLRVLIASLVVVCVLNVVLLVATINASRNERLQRLNSTIGIYMDDVATKFKAIDHFMDYSAVREPSLAEMTTIDPVADNVALGEPLDSIRRRVFDFQYSTGSDYQFFFYSPNTGYFTNLSTMTVSWDDYVQLRDSLITGWATKQKVIENPWNAARINGRYYLYHEVKYDSVVLFCAVRVSALTSPIQKSYLSKDDLAYVHLNGHDLVNRKDPRYVARGRTASKLIHRTDAYATLPFSLNVALNRFGRSEQFTLIQLVLMALTMGIAIVAMFGVFYLWRNFVVPLRAFSSTVTMLKDTDATPGLQNSHIKELENVNAQFHQLMNQVRSLKVSLYENEIQQKKTQIQFMQLQVRPHFYLNILTTLYSMQQMNQTAHMGELILAATRYMRYLLHAGAELVPLKQEVAHVNDYLKIQGIRYGKDVLQSTLTIAPAVAECLVPPLMLQTFVENAVKYAVSFDHPTLIAIDAREVVGRDSDVLAIHIQDNGDGFPQEILDALKNQHLIALSEQHIGINNVINRLDLLYNKSYRLDIGNRQNGGAYIDLTLPVQRVVKKGDLQDDRPLS